ncbi:MAG TPA: hypothetical protein VHV75_12915 [Solirubrobacteraceae bacterium]|nr:hypothetical protein [Solirubrobacteraceae bacterium]
MSRKPRLLAVASSGGHWVQLRRLAPAFEGHEVVWMTTDSGRQQEVGGDRLYVVKDASREDKRAVAQCALQTLRILIFVRPDVVVSTGAAPGYLAIRLAGLFGARTIWLDSVANVEMLSLSGRMASTRVDLCLTQWPHLADGPIQYLGAVL